MYYWIAESGSGGQRQRSQCAERAENDAGHAHQSLSGTASRRPPAALRRQQPHAVAAARAR